MKKKLVLKTLNQNKFSSNFFLIFIKQYAEANTAESLRIKIFKILDGAEATIRNIIEPVRNATRNTYFNIKKTGAKIESEVRVFAQKVLDIVSFILFY